MIFHSQLDEDELLGNGLIQPNAPEFKQMTEEDDVKRTFLSGEIILHFKQDPQKFKGNNRSVLAESYFYCKICLQSLDKTRVIRHCASYIHLFRCMKWSFPLEYERIIDPNDLNRSIEFVTKFYDNLIKREKGFNQVPKLILLDHLKNKFEEFKKNYPQNNSVIFLTNISLQALNDLNERDEERIIDDKRYKILRETNRPVNSFFQHILDSNEDDFIAAPLPETNQSDQRFADHQSNLRQRDRGSMKKIKENLFIKKEPVEETQFDNYRIEKKQPTPESEAEMEPQSEEHDIEENSIEFLKELANKALNVIEINDLDIDEDFIENFKKYGDLLVYYDFIDVNQSDLLNRMFIQIEENNQQQQNIESNNCQLKIIDTSFIKTEMIYE